RVASEYALVPGLRDKEGRAAVVALRVEMDGTAVGDESRVDVVACGLVAKRPGVIERQTCPPVDALERSGVGDHGLNLGGGSRASVAYVGGPVCRDHRRAAAD